MCSIVIGPGIEKDKGRGPTDPPLFSSNKDVHVWRKQVAIWVDLIATAAEKGSDKLCKTVLATFGGRLYDGGLPQAQMSIVNEAQ